MEFKGTKGIARYSKEHDCITVSKEGIVEGSKRIATINYWRKESEVDSETLTDAINVRQQIDFPLTELLEKYNELKASRNRELEKAVMYGYNTFEHGLSQRQLQKRAESYPLSQIVEP